MWPCHHITMLFYEPCDHMYLSPCDHVTICTCHHVTKIPLCPSDWLIHGRQILVFTSKFLFSLSKCDIFMVYFWPVLCILCIINQYDVLYALLSIILIINFSVSIHNVWSVLFILCMDQYLILIYYISIVFYILTSIIYWSCYRANHSTHASACCFLILRFPQLLLIP